MTRINSPQSAELISELVLITPENGCHFLACHVYLEKNTVYACVGRLCGLLGSCTALTLLQLEWKRGPVNKISDAIMGFGRVGDVTRTFLALPLLRGKYPCTILQFPTPPCYEFEFTLMKLLTSWKRNPSVLSQKYIPHTANRLCGVQSDKRCLIRALAVVAT